ncbi:MAG: DUF58 domain-containing protein [Halothece sp.]
MNIAKKTVSWLENRFCTPAYGGWVLLAMAVCLFAAAINTMSGWLYVISGTIFALLGLAAFGAMRSPKSIKINRLPIPPVSAGDQLTIELELENPTPKPKTLLQVSDFLPLVLGKPITKPIEVIPPKGSYRLTYYHPTQQRGIYYWHEVHLRSGNPLGLFWSRRRRSAPAKAIVYPTVFPLTNCPLVDTIGQDDDTEFYSDRYFTAANQGITKSLRPYRYGDSTRLIHWRTSARYGELQVRELEVITGGQEVIICLDSGSNWNAEDFEQAVIAAASLYFYAKNAQRNVKLWTAKTGLIQGNRVVLEALAGTYPQEEAIAPEPPKMPLIWISQTPTQVDSLPKGSRCVFFPKAEETLMISHSLGLTIDREEPLKSQLQKPLR